MIRARLHLLAMLLAVSYLSVLATSYDTGRNLAPAYALVTLMVAVVNLCLDRPR